jgi:Ca-activated chloride channel family protein
MLNRDDFDNDKVDAGDVGSGQTVTRIIRESYRSADARTIGDLRYSHPDAAYAVRLRRRRANMAS